MLFSSIAVFGTRRYGTRSWCFGDQRDDDIPTERPLTVDFSKEGETQFWTKQTLQNIDKTPIFEYTYA